MNAVGKFYKVSLEQFISDVKNTFEHVNDDNIEVLNIVQIYNDIKIPKRSTAGSAGYDFASPFGFTIAPGETVKIPTGIRVEMENGWWLGCFPRSGLGFKYRLQLDNTVGVIDSDYAYSDNEGHIFAKITNDSMENKTICIYSGDAFMQGIFIPFGVTYDDDANGVRNGGFGSTDKK